MTTRTEATTGARPEPDDPETPLTAAQAQAMIDERIETFGLGAVPKVAVTKRADGRWRVRWTTHEASCRPMSLRRWRGWVERHICSLDPERLETSEG